MLHEKHPAVNGGANLNNQAGGKIDDPILADLDELALHVDATFVVVVQVTGGGFDGR